MWKAIALCGALFLQADCSIPLKKLAPFYKSGDEIMLELQGLSTACFDARLSIQHRNESGGRIDVVHVTGRKEGDVSKRRQALFVFGEHARELVSSESALHLVHRLCEGSGLARKMLMSWDFTIVPIANREGRVLVEQKGDYCKRTNVHGVDLNRNWGDEHRDDTVFQKVAESEPDDDDKGGDYYLQQNPGPHGFSEPETSMLRKLVAEVQPEVFLSIHSGAYLLSMPFGYSMHAPPPANAHNMKSVLKSISDRFCGGRCPYGRLAHLIGYNSTGCDIDYVSESLKVPYAFTWEIYASPKNRAHFMQQALDDRAGQDGEAKEMQEGRTIAFLPPLKKHVIDVDQLEDEQGSAVSAKAPIEDTRVPSAGELRALADASCFEQFNPQDQGVLAVLLDNWSEAYLALCSTIETVDRDSSTSSVARLSTLMAPDPDSVEAS